MGTQTGVLTLPQGGRNTNPAQIVAPETLRAMDEEVSTMLKDSYARSLHVIETHRTEWERLAKALIEHEELDKKQVMQAVNGERVTKKIVNKFITPIPPPNAATDDKKKQQAAAASGGKRGGGLPVPAVPAVTPAVTPAAK